MLNKYLFFAAGRVAHPLVECVVSSQQQQQQQQQQLVGEFVPVMFGAPMLLPLPMHVTPISRGQGVGSPGALHATQPLLSPSRPGDWTCACGFSNFSSRMSCFGCQRPREKAATTTLKPGDWSCPCGTHNFARRTHCMTCDAPKPIVASYPAPSTHGERVLPGDWLCAACNAHNFRSRDLCIRCGDKKPAGHDSTSLAVPWTCAACHTANPSSRRDCEICGVTRPNEMHNAPPTESSAPSAASLSTPRVGDWVCTQCNYNNFAVRANCKSCAAARPVESGAPARAPVLEMKKGDWTCSCGCHNFAKRLRCFECQSQKPPQTAGVDESSNGSATVPVSE